MKSFVYRFFAWFKKQNFSVKEKLAAELNAVIEAERKKMEEEKSAFEYARFIPHSSFGIVNGKGD